MKSLKLIHGIEELVKLADKEFYYRKNNLQVRFSSEDSIFLIGTSEDGMGYLSDSYGFEIDFKFYMKKDGTMLLRKGVCPNCSGIRDWSRRYILSTIRVTSFSSSEPRR